MKKLIIAIIAVLILLLAPLVYNEYTLNSKMSQMQTYVDKTQMPFKVFRPPAVSVDGLTNYTKLQMAITDDGIVYYYGKSEYKPNLIEPFSLIIVQHVYIENNSEAGFATEKNGQKYFYFPYESGLRTLAFSKNTTYPNLTEIVMLFAGSSNKTTLEEEPEYSREMIRIAESMSP